MARTHMPAATRIAVKKHSTRARWRWGISAAVVLLVAVGLTAFVVSQRKSVGVGEPLDRTAQAEYQEGNSSGAEQKWLQAIQKDPTYLPTYLHLGSDYLQSSRPAQAAQCYTAATLLDPHNGLAWLHLAQSEMAANEMNKAANSAQTATRLLPNNADALTVQGQIQERETNIGAAISDFRQALALAPGDRLAALELARTEITTHQMGQAEQDFLPYLRSHLQDPEACFLLAGYYEEQQHTPANLQQALQYAQQARAEAPDNPDAATEVGDTEFALGHFREALAAYLSAQKRDAQSRHTLMGLARCYTALQQPQKAAEISSELNLIVASRNQILHWSDDLHYDPADVNADLKLAALEEADDNPDQAQADYIQAVRQAPQNPQARADLVTFYRRTHQPALAQQAQNMKFVP